MRTCEDVQGIHPTDAVVWIGDLDSVQKGAETQSFPPQLSSTDTEAQVSGPDSRHGGTGADGNLQHIRHAETERERERPIRADGRREAAQRTLPWKCRHGFPTTRRPSPSIQGHSEDIPEVSADQPGQLRRPRPGPTVLEEDSEDRRITAAKSNARLANPHCAHPATPTLNRSRPVHAASGRTGHQSALQDIFVSTAAPELHQLLSTRPALPHHPHRQLTLIAVTITHYHPPPTTPSLPKHPPRRLLYPPPLDTILKHQRTSTPPSTKNPSDVDSTHTRPHCGRTFTSHIGLVGHLRIHRTETDVPVPGAPTYTRCIRLYCPHCPRTFMHRMGLLGHMRTHENLR
ncbi:hypothetical protein SprV_0401669900 [Sparganum proliferum]